MGIFWSFYFCRSFGGTLIIIYSPYILHVSTKAVIQQLDDDPSPELIRIWPKKKEVGSCCKKLDMNVLPEQSYVQKQVEDGLYDYSMSLVPFEHSQVTECCMAYIEHEVNDLYVPIEKEVDAMDDVRVDFSCLDQRENLYDFNSLSDNGYKNMGEYEEEVAEDEEDGQQEEEEDEKQEDGTKEETYEDDGDYIVHPKVLFDDLGCRYKIYRFTKEEPRLVKIVIDEHLCLQARKMKAYTSRFLATIIIHKVNSNPRILISALHEELHMELELSLSKMKVFRAKSIAKDQLYGDFEKQYNFFKDYCLELHTDNRGTTVKLEVCRKPNPQVQTQIFNRLYICLRALNLGFKVGQRELLGLNGRLLKGAFPGKMLIVVGLDSNNGIYLIAYVVVEVESQDSWTWFLKCLSDDLELDASCNFTFYLTDKRLEGLRKRGGGL
ncbi:unnamed protein product [Lactuca saligna]|uniref:MULE transposase domain-containing protein n=1 Tax=Lactuca saligna TaxID=75948 RepID=A0AA35Z6L9_LACSI|nr:unnamed protein product [Lactuca saligna]